MQTPLSLSKACIAGAAALSLTLAASLPAAAASPISFFGTINNTNPGPKNVPPCGAQLTIINKNEPPTFKSAGFSNLGDFSFNIVQCLMPPQNGSIEFVFGGGNTLVGSWASSSSPSSTPLVFQVAANSDITGGTGTFAGYTGSITALGYLDRRDSTVAGSDFIAGSAFVFRGELMPVPEPGTWGMLAIGLLGVLATAARRSKAAAA